MPLINRVIRPEVRGLKPYSVPSSEGFIKLDAMENPYRLPEFMQRELGTRLSAAPLNRYPIPSYRGLKEKIKTRLGVPAGYDVLLGNGSDELISMLAIACAQPGAKMLVPTPGFVMYELSAQLTGLEFIGVPVLNDFNLDQPAMLAAIERHRPTLVYLAYPNNPTGALFKTEEIMAIIRAMQSFGIVVVDEAYHPFAQTSFMSRLPEFENLIVMRTLSKLGLAGLRLGYLSASEVWLTQLDKVRPPYNVNVLTEIAAEYVLDHHEILDAQAALLRQARATLSLQLTHLPEVTVFPSAANFILIRVPDADKVFNGLLAQHILVKNVGTMHPLLRNCLRVTVGTPDENQLFLEALQKIIS